MKHGNQLRIGQVLTQLESLLSLKPVRMKEAFKHYPNRQGVYAISDPEDSEIVYVGMSVKAVGGVGQRLLDHLKNKEKAVLKSMVGGDRKEAERYFVRVFELDDYISRRNLEAFATSTLSPKYNK